ncbi:MAG: hypothetical protein ACEQSK_05375 [Sphingomonadaceae bacterium]
MNIAKNMEAIFVIAVALASVTSFATAAANDAAAVATTIVKVDNSKMQVVTVSAKRLTAAQKAALGN